MSGVDRANGHKPAGLMNLFHPALQSAPRPTPADMGYELVSALDALVRVHAYAPEDAFTAHTLGHEREGSGIVIDDDGLVLTIGYLIVEAVDVTLTVAGMGRVPADVVAYDHETGFGMVRALKKIDVAPLSLGRSSAARVGDNVVVAAHGGLDQAISGRVVSRREFAGSWEYMLEEAFFTTPMHPFWGGAALIDAGGELIGTGSLYVEHALEGSSQAGNMFVPIDYLHPIYDAMVSTGRAGREARPWLGLSAVEIDSRLIVSGASPDGPADAAGITAMDTILSLDGEPVSTLPDMYRTLWAAGPAGIEVRLTVLRDDDVLNVKIYSGDRYEFLKLPQRH